MELVDGALKSEQGVFTAAGNDQVPLTCRDYLIQRYKGVNYYLIDLAMADWKRLSNIISACEAVERACWKPQENFFEYLAKCDILTYAEKDGRVIAFDVVTRLYSGQYCVYSNDETMVLKECRGMDIARKLVILTLEWFFTRTDCFKGRGAEYLVFTSISANPRVVNFYFKNSWSRIFFDCSFNPSPKLISLKEEYCRKHKISLVNSSYPFCFSNLFPGSNSFDPNDPRFQFSSKVKANMPHDFDHMGRGDAFAFMYNIPMIAARVVVLLLMIRCFGRSYLSTQGVSLFNRKKQALSVNTKPWGKEALREPRPLHITQKEENVRQGKVSR